MAVEMGRLVGSYDRVADTHGRHIITEAIPSDLAPNMLKGREGHTANTASMKEIREGAGDMYGLIRYLRSGFPEDKLNLQQLIDITSLMSVLPIYMALRKNNPIEEHSLPPATIDLARTSEGIILPLQGIRDSGVPMDERISSYQIYRFANGANPSRKNYFLAEEGPEACPAPEHIIKPVLDAIIKRPAAEDMDGTVSQWKDYLDLNELPKATKFGKLYKIMQLYSQRLHTTPKENFMRIFEISTRLDQLYILINPTLGYADKPDTSPELVSFFESISRAISSPKPSTNN